MNDNYGDIFINDNDGNINHNGGCANHIKIGKVIGVITVTYTYSKISDCTGYCFCPFGGS